MMNIFWVLFFTHISTWCSEADLKQSHDTTKHAVLLSTPWRAIVHTKLELPEYDQEVYIQRGEDSEKTKQGDKPLCHIAWKITFLNKQDGFNGVTLRDLCPDSDHFARFNALPPAHGDDTDKRVALFETTEKNYTTLLHDFPSPTPTAIDQTLVKEFLQKIHDEDGEKEATLQLLLKIFNPQQKDSKLRRIKMLTEQFFDTST